MRVFQLKYQILIFQIYMYSFQQTQINKQVFKILSIGPIIKQNIKLLMIQLLKIEGTSLSCNLYKYKQNNQKVTKNITLAEMSGKTYSFNFLPKVNKSNYNNYFLNDYLKIIEQENIINSRKSYLFLPGYYQQICKNDSTVNSIHDYQNILADFTILQSKKNGLCISLYDVTMRDDQWKKNIKGILIQIINFQDKNSTTMIREKDGAQFNINIQYYVLTSFKLRQNIDWISLLTSLIKDYENKLSVQNDKIKRQYLSHTINQLNKIQIVQSHINYCQIRLKQNNENNKLILTRIGVLSFYDDVQFLNKYSQDLTNRFKLFHSYYQNLKDDHLINLNLRKKQLMQQKKYKKKVL